MCVCVCGPAYEHQRETINEESYKYIIFEKSMGDMNIRCLVNTTHTDDLHRSGCVQGWQDPLILSYFHATVTFFWTVVSLYYTNLTLHFTTAS